MEEVNVNIYIICVLRCFSHVWLCDPMDYSPPDSSVQEILQVRILEWVACPPPGDLLDPGMEPVSPRSPALQADSLLLSPWGSPSLNLHEFKFKKLYVSRLLSYCIV